MSTFLFVLLISGPASLHPLSVNRGGLISLHSFQAVSPILARRAVIPNRRHREPSSFQREAEVQTKKLPQTVLGRGIKANAVQAILIASLFATKHFSVER